MRSQNANTSSYIPHHLATSFPKVVARLEKLRLSKPVGPSAKAQCFLLLEVLEEAKQHL
jgi:hypothetical protein